MKNIIIVLMMYTASNNNVFGNVAFIEGDITNELKFSKETNAEQNSFIDTNGKTLVLSEPFTDLNNNGEYDYAEEYIDDNRNGKYDVQEPFIDKGNGVYDTGEEFVDVNGNHICDSELWYVDNNRNGKWDAGDPFEDLNNDGIKGYNEPFIDNNNNNRYDTSEKTGNFKFSFNAILFSESFTDVPNGRYDIDEKYEDINNDGKWTSAEKYDDLNGDGKWTPAEKYEDLNGDGKWTAEIKQHDPIEKNIINQQNVELLISDTLKTSLQEGIMANQNDIISNTLPYKRSFKSPGKALLYSGVLPGIGQAYMGNWMRALLFVSIDAVAIRTWKNNNDEAEEKKREYTYYANDHWDFGRWVHDYYKWYEYKDDNDDWNAIRQVFTNYSDTLLNCDEDISLPHCYIDIWDHSHKIEFTYNGNTVSSSSDKFKEIFQVLCDNSNIWDTKCSNDVLDMKDSKGDTIFVIKDHHFYEGVQKYDMFFAGWDDNDSVFVVVKEHGDINATSPNQIAYRTLWGRYNTIKTLSLNAGKFMLINRVVSMVDALLLAKKWNNKNNMKLSLNAYPDLRNKSGLGGIKLSLQWK